MLMILTLLFIKHWVADFILQTDAMVQGKGTYGNWEGLKHSLIHGAFTFAIVAPVDFGVALVVALFDFVAHYHIDWAKMNLNKKLGYTIDKPGFWMLLGLDQLAHQICYIIIATYIALL